MTQRRDDMSLGNERTFDNKVERPTMNRSLGEQSTIGGQADSPISPLDSGEFLTGDDMEIVDLSKRYRIEGVIGQGGMGQVFLATDTRLDRKVAIKRILGEASRNRSALQRFLIEAKSIAALSHPNIVHVHDAGRATDGPFLIMEYVDGASLLDRCRDGAMPLAEAVDLACQLCDGLAKAHEAGIIHRDIKPANILITNDGHPKLTDFGLAKAETADGGMTMTGAVLGTLDFMPPEQRRDAALVDARSDLWSLAATVYQMVTGRSPKIIRFSNVPLALQEVLGKALEEKKEDRYQSANDLKQALRAAVTGVDQKQKTLLTDLDAGECLACHTRNEGQRKFCRECGVSLRCYCLACQHQIPIWDKICPECGANQNSLTNVLIEELLKHRAQAEKFVAEHDYETAGKYVKLIALANHPRVQDQKAWAEDFLKVIERKRARHAKVAVAYFKEAQKFRASNDYAGAINALDSIPSSLMNEEMIQYREKLMADKELSTRLLVTARQCIADTNLLEAKSLIESLIPLRGYCDEVLAILKELRESEKEQEDESWMRVQSLMSEGDARGALRIAKKVDGICNSRKFRELFEHVERVVAVESELVAEVQKTNATKSAALPQVISLLLKTIEYLGLNPSHRHSQALYLKLISRLSRTAARDFEGLPTLQLAALPASVVDQLPSAVRDVICFHQNSVGMKFRLVGSGAFIMGEGAKTNVVNITKPYYIGVCPITHAVYSMVMLQAAGMDGASEELVERGSLPVADISWNEAVEFCRRLSERIDEKANGHVYRLPTEAEWEYACRSGSVTHYCFGDDDSELCEYAWFKDNSGGASRPVGRKKPNEWGLHDMHGNVWEFCLDCLDSYRPGVLTDPGHPSVTLPSRISLDRRGIRGGSWASAPQHCQVTSRQSVGTAIRDSNLGFRVVMEVHRSGASREVVEG